jgi:hypothetical protein
MKWATRQPPSSAVRLLRRARPGLPALPLALALAACSATGGTAANEANRPSGSPASSPKLTVTSTLDRHSALPLRIHWQAFPNVPAAEVSEVDFLIDGRLGWVEHHTLYFYGDDGNWLVTSCLNSGEHTFTVRVIDTGGHTATDTVHASVTAAAPPPPTLRGVTWARQVTPSDVQKATSGQPPPAGRWQLRISPVGWQLHDPDGGGLLFDVGYRPGGRLQMRPVIEYPPYPNSNSGGFCQDTDPLWPWTYAVGGGGTTLTLRPAGHDLCGDRIAILAGTWTQAGK